MSDANRSQISYIEEVTWGVTPATPTLQRLRFTDGGPDFNIDNIVSNEIRSDRQTTDLVQTGADVSGPINFELSYKAIEDFFEGSLWSAGWIGVGSGSTEVLTSGATGSNEEFTLNATANTITFGSGVTHAIVPGQFFELTDSATDDGYHFVTNVTGQVVTVQAITTGEVLDETDLATIKGSIIRNGVTEHSYTIEKSFDDKGRFSAFVGCVPNSLAITAAANSVITGSVDFIGKTANNMATATVATTFSAAETNDVMNAVANVGNILEGSTLAAVGAGIFFQELSFTVNNNVRGLPGIGTLGYVDIGVGAVDVTGTLNAYFENETLYNKYVNATATGLSFKVEDNAGNAYVFTFPRIKFITAPLPIPGRNTDIMQNMTWQAIRHATYGYTAEICRIAA